MRSLIVFLCLCTSGAFAQGNFIRTYSLFQNSEMYFVEPLKDGGYIISGKCGNASDNTTNFCFMKTDAVGNVVWANQYSDSTLSVNHPMNEWASVIREKNDGSFVFGGSADDPSYNYGVAYYGWLNAEGEVTNSLIKTTSWKTSVNSLLLDVNENIISTRDDNEGAGHHINLLEVNSSSGQYISGSSCGNFSLAKQSLVKMPDGGYAGIAIDETYYFDPNYNNLPIVTRFDADGYGIWNFRIHNEVYGSDTQFVSICATQDTGVLVCGFTSSGTSKIILTKFNSAGDSIWTKSIGSVLDQYPSTIQQTTDGGFAITGRIGNDILLLKLDANCNPVWSKIFGGNGLDKPVYFQQTPDNGFIILAHTESFGSESVMLIKTDYAGDISNSTTTSGKVDPEKELFLYPDPFSSSINISIPGNHTSEFKLYDMAGRIVFEKTISNGVDHFELSFLPAGIYNATIIKDGIPVSKMIAKQ